MMLMEIYPDDDDNDNSDNRDPLFRATHFCSKIDNEDDCTDNDYDSDSNDSDDSNNHP